jgi:hypothetical protein
MKIIAIYDKPSCVDRYTVYFNVVEGRKEGHVFYRAVGMSEDPFYPLGFYQHVSGCLGRHNGKKIHLRDLPKECLVALVQELQE